MTLYENHTYDDSELTWFVGTDEQLQKFTGSFGGRIISITTSEDTLDDPDYPGVPQKSRWIKSLPDYSQEPKDLPSVTDYSIEL